MRDFQLVTPVERGLLSTQLQLQHFTIMIVQICKINAGTIFNIIKKCMYYDITAIPSRQAAIAGTHVFVFIRNDAWCLHFFHFISWCDLISSSTSLFVWRPWSKPLDPCRTYPSSSTRRCCSRRPEDLPWMLPPSNIDGQLKPAVCEEICRLVTSRSNFCFLYVSFDLNCKPC